MTVADLKAAIESDAQIPTGAQHLSHNDRNLSDPSQTLVQAGISDGDMLGLTVQAAQARGQKRAHPGGSSSGRGVGQGSSQQQQRIDHDPEIVRLQMLGDPQMLEAVRAQNPELAGAVEDAQRFKDILVREQRKALEAERAKEVHLAKLNADPFNIEAQREIEEMIRQAAVTENLQNAMEHTPEGMRFEAV